MIYLDWTCYKCVCLKLGRRPALLRLNLLLIVQEYSYRDGEDFQKIFCVLRIFVEIPGHLVGPAFYSKTSNIV